MIRTSEQFARKVKPEREFVLQRVMMRTCRVRLALHASIPPLAAVQPSDGRSPTTISSFSFGENS